MIIAKKRLEEIRPEMKKIEVKSRKNKNEEVKLERTEDLDLEKLDEIINSRKDEI